MSTNPAKPSTIMDFAHDIDQQRQLGRNRSTKLASDPMFGGQNQQLTLFWLALNKDFSIEKRNNNIRVMIN